VLLRGVNVGRGNRIAMRDLVLLLEGLGCGGVVTHGGSGNAVVDADPAGLPERVEQALQQFGLPVRVLVRTADELAAVVAANPFPELVERPKQLHVAFLDTQPAAEVVDQVGRRHGDDELVVGDRAVYLAFTASSHDSPLQPALARLGVVLTARNWSAVTKVLALAQR